MTELTKKWNGLPVWAWIVGGLAIAYVAYRLLKGKGIGGGNSNFSTPADQSAAMQSGGGGSSSPPPVIGTPPVSSVNPNSGVVVDSSPSDYNALQASSGVSTPFDSAQYTIPAGATAYNPGSALPVGTQYDVLNTGYDAYGNPVVAGTVIGSGVGGSLLVPQGSGLTVSTPAYSSPAPTLVQPTPTRTGVSKFS